MYYNNDNYKLIVSSYNHVSRFLSNRISLYTIYIVFYNLHNEFDDYYLVNVDTEVKEKFSGAYRG